VNGKLCILLSCGACIQDKAAQNEKFAVAYVGAK